VCGCEDLFCRIIRHSLKFNLRRAVKHQSMLLCSGLSRPKQLISKLRARGRRRVRNPARIITSHQPANRTSFSTICGVRS
jgi:hypothetical protein